MKTLTLATLALLCGLIIGCTSATATKVAKDGTSDSIKVRAFLSSIQDGSYSSSGSNGIILTVTANTPDQQAIATLAGGVVELAKAGLMFAEKAPTSTVTNNIVVTNTFTLPNR